MHKIKERLDLLLFKKGLAETQKKAEAMIISGAVSVEGVPVTKPGTLVDILSEVKVKEGSRYVSRGALKLDSAAVKLCISFENKVCLDIGASTGGFTDYMLQHGAKKVYAVDVGKNLLHEKLKSDPRVVNIEETNFRHFSKDLLKDDIEFVTIDASFISLEKILPTAAKCVQKGGEILAMVKPQFEASPKDLIKGVVKNEEIRIKTIEKIKNTAQTLGLELKGEEDSEIKGPKEILNIFMA